MNFKTGLYVYVQERITRRMMRHATKLD